MTKKAKTWTCAAAALACVAAVLCFALRNDAPYEVEYITAKVEKATIGNSVTATGTIEPVTEVEVGTQVSGMISHIYVDYNSVVKKGQVKETDFECDGISGATLTMNGVTAMFAECIARYYAFLASKQQP